ncbi:MAG: hypothetical protein GC149_16460 [Gammaproteobacteria bacterium]|nr:hypothetical protein [Gammaproteobacteria bacterium]
MNEKQKKSKTGKPPKAKRPKLVRDSFTMPETDYARIKALKLRLLNNGVELKKSEVLRAGLLALEGMSDTQLQKLVGQVERIKTGRPSGKDKD